MVGPWPLTPHRDHLKYIHHVHLMQRDQNRDVTAGVDNFLFDREGNMEVKLLRG